MLNFNDLFSRTIIFFFCSRSKYNLHTHTYTQLPGLNERLSYTNIVIRAAHVLLTEYEASDYNSDAVPTVGRFLRSGRCTQTCDLGHERTKI